MAANTSWISPALTGLGMGVGALAGGVPGATVGGSLGAAAGGLLTAGLNLGDKPPEFPKPSEEEKVLLAKQMDLANRLSNIEGFTPQEISSYTNIMLENDLQSQQVINAYASVDRLSPAEKQLLQKAYTDKRQRTILTGADQLLTANARVAGQRVTQAVNATGVASKTADVVQTKEAFNRLKTLEFKQQQISAFSKAATAAGLLVSSAGELYDKYKAADAFTSDEDKALKAEWKKAESGQGILGGMANKAAIKDDANQFTNMLKTERAMTEQKMAMAPLQSRIDDLIAELTPNVYGNLTPPSLGKLDVPLEMMSRSEFDLNNVNNYLKDFKVPGPTIWQKAAAGVNE